MDPRVLLIEVTLQRSVALERFLRFWFSVPYIYHGQTDGENQLNSGSNADENG